ncbi:MAG: helix-turn-helix transcriptional regulator, partial [Bradyrhizobium sp.]|uniref:helix-turn-helix domain-containing protein n=1 Tax=Bradyrhizobium sp. TaxID=376 RepID=UPI001DC4D52A
ANANALLVSSRKGPANVTYRLDGRLVSRQVQQGGIFFLPPGRDCEVHLHAPLDTIHVYVRSDLFGERAGDCKLGTGLVPILGETDGVTGNLLAVLEEILREEDSSCSLLAESVSHAIANRLMTISRLDGRPSLPAVARQLSSRRVRAVREFVESNLADCIKLADLAAICSLSSEHFIRMFKSAVGVSPHRYVLGVRIVRAKQLLANRECSLADIAHECGFAHQQHFTSTFRRMTGFTPGAYRRSMN